VKTRRAFVDRSSNSQKEKTPIRMTCHRFARAKISGLGDRHILKASFSRRAQDALRLFGSI
jgi:hypothetical protein